MADIEVILTSFPQSSSPRHRVAVNRQTQPEVCSLGLKPLIQGTERLFGRRDQVPGSDHRLRRLEVWGHEDVGVDERDLLPDPLQDGAGNPAWRQGPAQVETLGRAGGFYGQYSGDVLDEPAQFAAGAPAHGVVVFLRGGGGEGACARGVCEAAVLFRQGGRRVVRDHEPRVDARPSG